MGNDCYASCTVQVLLDMALNTDPGIVAVATHRSAADGWVDWLMIAIGPLNTMTTKNSVESDLVLALLMLTDSLLVVSSFVHIFSLVYCLNRSPFGDDFATKTSNIWDPNSFVRPIQFDRLRLYILSVDKLPPKWPIVQGYI